MSSEHYSEACSSATLKSLCLLVVDCPHSTPVWTDEGVIVLRNQNIKNGRLDLSSPSYTDEENFSKRIKRAQPSFGDIVITREAPMGDVCAIPKGLKCCLGQRQVLLRPDPKKIDSRFLLFALQSPIVQHQIGWNEGTGSTVSNLRIPVLEALNIPTPPLLQQQEIAVTLSALDDRIALLRDTNATLEAIAQALFKSWFVDFDPVHANAGTQAPSLPPEIQALFPATFTDSPQGPIPEGWSWKTLDEAYEINPKRLLKKGVVAKYLDMASVQTQGHVTEDVIDREFGSGTKFCNGDTLLARITPCLENGKTAFVDFLEPSETGWGSTEFVVLKPKAPLPDFHGYLLARQSVFREFAIQSMSGTSGRQRVQNDVLGSFNVAIPDEPIAKAFSQVVTPIQLSISANHKQAKTLANLRDSILPRLISGQLKLPEVTVSTAEVN